MTNVEKLRAAIIEAGRSTAGVESLMVWVSLSFVVSDKPGFAVIPLAIVGCMTAIDFLTSVLCK